jgi:hypothetical protein
MNKPTKVVGIRKRHVKLQERLADLGLAQGERVTCMFISYEKYASSANSRKTAVGIIRGCIMEHDLNLYTDFCIYNVAETALGVIYGLELNKSGELAGQFSTTIQSITMTSIAGGDTQPTLVMDNSCIIPLIGDPVLLQPNRLDHINDDDVFVEDVTSDVESSVSIFNGPGRILFNRKQFVEAVKNGCGCCCSSILPIDDKTIGWTQDMSPICASCCSKPQIEPLIVDFPLSW